MLVDLIWRREELLNSCLQDDINTDRAVEGIQVAIFINNLKKIMAAVLPQPGNRISCCCWSHVIIIESITFNHTVKKIELL